MKYGFSYIVQKVTRIHCPSYAQFHLGLGSQLHKCGRPRWMLQYQDHSYTFSMIFPLLFLVVAVTWGAMRFTS